jgi:hypothetical protein
MSYYLKAIGDNEFLVFPASSDMPVGSIRKFQMRYGWRDRQGWHDFSSKHDAAVACLKQAPTRQHRQRTAAELARQEAERHRHENRRTTAH